MYVLYCMVWHGMAWYVCVSVSVSVCVCLCIMYGCMHPCMHACIHACVCVCVYNLRVICVCVCSMYADFVRQQNDKIDGNWRI